MKQESGGFKEAKLQPGSNTDVGERRSAHLEQIAVVVHHEQNHQVHLSFGESPAVDDGAGEGPFHRHPVLNLGEKFRRVSARQRGLPYQVSVGAHGSHFFVQFDLLGFGRCGHEPQEPTELLPAARVLQLQAQLDGLQSLR